MPRQPNPKSDEQIIVRAKNEAERQKIKAFKEVCVLDGLAQKSEILSLLELFLRQHNYPPGNPQTSLQSFGVQTKITQECEYPNCREIATYECAPTSPLAKTKVFYCKKHHRHAQDNRLLKSSKRL